MDRVQECRRGGGLDVEQADMTRQQPEEGRVQIFHREGCARERDHQFDGRNSHRRNSRSSGNVNAEENEAARTRGRT